MGEPKGKELARIRDTFVAAYNAIHGTSYVPSETKPAEPTDLLFQEPKGAELRVQLVRAVGDPNSEFRHPAAVDQFVIRPLQAQLRLLGSKGFVVSVSIDRLPSTTAERQDLFPRIWLMISRELGPIARGAPWSIKRGLHLDRYILQDYSSIAQYVTDIDVHEVGGQEQTVVIWTPTAAAFIVDAASQAAASLTAKSNHYGTAAKDHVLVIQCETLPYFGSDVRALRDAIASGTVPSAFREVWLVSLWREPSADLVWPIEPSAGSATQGPS